jgi:hypothetical protein
VKTPAERKLVGREKLLDQLEQGVLDGSTLLLLGPWGIGKSSILAALLWRIRDTGRPCGLAHDVHRLRDITAALTSAYPNVDAPSLSQRRLRSRLRLAVEERPGALLLDHVSAAGTAMKGFLRSLRGTGFGVVLAADTETARDHVAVRAFHLTHQEITVPPLAGPTMARIMETLLAPYALPHPLHADDRRILLRLAKGNPGKLVAFIDLLTDARFWRRGRVSTTSVHGAALEVVLRHYVGGRS